MNYRPQPYFRTLAFTLIELLTVITIIAILMGLLFPAIGIAKDQARKAEAKTAVTGIVTAVKQYYTEYGKYPLGAQAQPSAPADVLFGDSSIPQVAGSNQVVFDILRNVNSTQQGQPNQYNPRAIVFFEGKSAPDATNPKSGFATQDAGTTKKGAFVDPWGKEYGIAIDGDYDNKISNLPYTDFQQTDTAPLTGVCAFSMGKDNVVGSKKKANVYRDSGTNSDDIISWQ
jgi:prepilin-type N-terminal cleavage/methylation domain-containing protein